MISWIAADSRRLFLIVCAIAAVGLLSAQTVRPSCTYAVASFGGEAQQKEAAERGYQEAIAAGHCAPPHARWQFWRG
ncbi:hypothetical protein [Streptomyces sp. SID2119]|uniref:hypothetical protein n=1 Tax=Streptomyces sp. SID2119 TaxID=2690253 RepID=UPI00137055F3|nr:hypothetical protein [Streptomyces sp. SID2119]MYW29344.1 hypothetical protein [Streptomyces sp. SID2119]